jgi:hypothetical protein
MARRRDGARADQCGVAAGACSRRQAGRTDDGVVEAAIADDLLLQDLTGWHGRQFRTLICVSTRRRMPRRRSGEDERTRRVSVGGLGRGHFHRDYLDEPGKPGTWVFPDRTGKWKGVIGSGTDQRVSSSKLAAASSRVIASAFAASADATRSRLGRGHGVSCCNRLNVRDVDDHGLIV